ARVDLVRPVAAAAGGRTRVRVNGRTDVALAAGVAGVHLPGSAPPASRIRAVVPTGFLIGRSVHEVEEARSVERDGGCDYLVFGTVFPSTGKPAGHRAAGIDALRAVCDAVRLPVLAIGGIDADRAADVAKAGAAGVAAIGLFVTTSGEAEPARRIGERVAAVRAAFAA